MLYLKTFSEIVLNIINNIHDKLPFVDTKEGTFMRDTYIDPVANEFEDVYDDLYKMKIAQSVLTATGKDLDKLAANFFIKRKAGTGSVGSVRFYITNSNNDISQTTYPDLRISKGTIVSTQGTKSQPAKQFQTTTEIFISGTTTSQKASDNTTIISGIAALPKDSTGFRYFDVVCESLDTGADTNISPYEIVAQNGISSNLIFKVTNVSSFSGGSDPEDDISLALRISLAISGANIGVKNGYRSYILKQPQVLDAYIVGAGDPYMNRDLLKVYDEATGLGVEQHIGGKVDIYVRTNTEVEDTFSYTITQDDLNNDYNVPLHINFPKNSKPIITINSIYGTIKNADGSYLYKSYINAENYEIEKTSDGTELYYNDILWDFSTKTDFPDTDYYPFLNDIDANEITRLKTKLDEELMMADKYLNNLSYKINWDLLTWEEPNNELTDTTTLFKYGKYSDNQFYKLKITSETSDGYLLNCRTFVKKQDNIYVRVYTTPDFKIVKDSSLLEGSTQSKDYISWLQNPNVKNIPEVNETLTIKYTYNNGIASLQDGIEEKRVMTADVLIKAAKQKDVEIFLSIICSKSYDPDEIKETIGKALTYHINSEKKLGDYLDISTIIYIVKGIDGVLSVDIDSAVLSFVECPDSQIIRCNPDEYFNLKNLILSVTNKSDL